jgi:hypothetical protein
MLTPTIVKLTTLPKIKYLDFFTLICLDLRFFMTPITANIIIVKAITAFQFPRTSEKEYNAQMYLSPYTLVSHPGMVP